jgi:hypothetical protein
VNASAVSYVSRKRSSPVTRHASQKNAVLPMLMFPFEYQVGLPFRTR